MRSLLQSLKDDESPWALRPASGDLLLQAASLVLGVSQAGAAPKSLKQERSNYRLWERFTRELGTPAWRADIMALSGKDPVGEMREALLQAYFLLWGRKHIVPKRKKDRWRTALPDSILGTLLGVRRVFRRKGLPPLRMDLVKQVYRGMQRQFVAAYGAKAIQPQRKEPFTSDLAIRVARPARGSKVGNRTVSDTSHFWVNWEALCKTEGSTGFRKDEVITDDNGVFHLTRGSLMLRLGLQEMAEFDSTELLLMRKGDGFFLMTPPCKNDPFGLYFGPTPIWLELNESDPLNAAAALRRMELQDPIRGRADREAAPMFTSEPGRGFTGGLIDRTLRQVLDPLVPAAQRDRYSWHSWRIYLACALLASGASRAQIQALVRWLSEASLDIYARMSNQQVSSLLLGAHLARVDTVRATSLVAGLPATDLEDAVAEVDDLGAETDRVPAGA